MHVYSRIHVLKLAASSTSDNVMTPITGHCKLCGPNTIVLTFVPHITENYELAMFPNWIKYPNN